MYVFDCCPGVMLERHDYAVPIDPSKPFDQKDYDKKYVCLAIAIGLTHARSPHLYRPVFHERIAPYLTALVNCMYWESRFPRLLTIEVRMLCDPSAAH